MFEESYRMQGPVCIEKQAFRALILPIKFVIDGVLSEAWRWASDKACRFEDFIGVWETWTGIWAGWASDKRLENKTSPRDIPEG